ncbi:MAG TPA: PspC domain-containing protein [Allosphingosinicella sp.]|jgi:phage shock protein PspC (stress-responsive transcriptional regulator)|uniref:PspC domain-containing protein n=1 Tax=Allosphingosinicella sp. TaxID=2823234 RepID=UPI002F2722A1
MDTGQPNLFTRPDTFFGVCEGLSEDLPFHPNILRLTLAGLFFWNPYVAIAAYAAAGLLVALLRWLIPNPRPAALPQASDADATTCALPEAERVAQAEPMPLAA